VPQYLPGIQPLNFAPLLVADLFAQGTTTSNLLTYMREKVFTNAAAPVLEGGSKPESTLTFESASDPVRKLAHWLPVTEEMLEDEPAVRAYIDARLRLGILQKEEQQLLNGTGVAPELAGLLTRAGLGASIARTDPDTNADALLKQKMALFASSLLLSDGFILNPTNWTSILLLKTTQGTYLAGGPFSPIQTPTLWGDPVAVTPATVAGTGIVGAFKTGAQIFRKGGIRVESSNSHVDYFVKNLVAIRAEERLALCVYRPGAFGTVTALT
jgi:HK97 family phage major capsid protein